MELFNRFPYLFHLIVKCTVTSKTWKFNSVQADFYLFDAV